MKNLRKKFPILLRRNQGFALIIVLSCLLFITALIVTFLVSMRTEVASSKASADSTQARQLGDMAVNLAIAQIREATLDAGTNQKAWASQPGMIRLYNNQGQPAGYRKLYSWDKMVGEGAFDPFGSGEQVPTGWFSDKAIFTDLNAPIEINSTKVYPIFDLDASTNVAAIRVDGAPKADNRPVPMPVKWLYVLADGSVRLPETAGSGGEIAKVDGASESNPIVGRIAFWADDDTCKININTASLALSPQSVKSSAPYEASSYTTPWDVPRYSTPAEQNFARFQPAQGEYQRYPGHPATVGLNAVFPVSGEQDIQDLFAMVPRAAYDGSKGGTVSVNAAKWINRQDLYDRLYASVDELIFQQNRTSSPLLNKSKLQAAKFFLTANSRAPELNLYGQPRVSIWPVHTTIKNALSSKVTVLDRLLAFCSTIGTGANAYPFYFTRSNAISAKEDIEGERNLVLLDYLEKLAGKQIPGFGGSFLSKYNAAEVEQILTLIFDYIRTTNTQDSLLTTNLTLVNNQWQNPDWFSATPTTGWGLGKGQVTPSIHPQWKTQGIGSFWRPVEVSIQFVGLGDGPLSSSPQRPGIPIPIEQLNQMRLPAVAGWIDPSITERKIDPSDSSPTAEKGWMPPDDERAIQAFLLVSFLNPAQSRISGSSRMWMKVTGLDTLKVSGYPATTWKPLEFPATGTMLAGANVGGDALGAGSFFGYLPINSLLAAGGYGRNIGKNNVSGSYPFYSGIISLPAGRTNGAMSFSGGSITIEIYDISAGPNLVNTSPSSLPTQANKIQEITVTFPPADSGALPLPGLTALPLIGTSLPVVPNGGTAPVVKFDKWKRVMNYDRWRLPTKQTSELLTETNAQFDGRFGKAIIDGVGVKDEVGNQKPDVVQSMLLTGQYADARLLAKSSIPANAFASHPLYGTASMAHNHFLGSGKPLAYNSGVFGSLVQSADYAKKSVYNAGDFSAGYISPLPLIPPTVTSVATWDWDNGIGNYPDGPWINKADEGSVSSGTTVPYYHQSGYISPPGQAFFSPNRQVSSPGTFGSLPTGISRGKGWQTLLFRPAPNGHPEARSPSDHLLMDLFWMPVVEPYAISEPFSTAGKINMNQQMVPFTYIKRYTGLHAAMMGETIATMPRSEAPTYKTLGGSDTAGNSTVSRLSLNLDPVDGTFKQLDEKFAGGEIFRSATEICDLYLVPKDYTLSTFQADWYNSAGKFALVGDNLRERPYANIYGKLTTKSNTYTVHYHVQVLSIPKSVQKQNPGVYNPALGCSVIADQRGSTTIERYLDPNDVRFASGEAKTFLQDPQASANFSLESYYRFHILQSSIFAP